MLGFHTLIGHSWQNRTATKEGVPTDQAEDLRVRATVEGTGAPLTATARAKVVVRVGAGAMAHQAAHAVKVQDAIPMEGVTIGAITAGQMIAAHAAITEVEMEGLPRVTAALTAADHGVIVVMTAA